MKLAKPAPEEPFKNLAHLAWIIVGDIFTANGITMTEDEHDPLVEALTAEVARRVARMQRGTTPPTLDEQRAAAQRLRGYGCWMRPHDINPAAQQIFADTANEWRRAHLFASIARRPPPGKIAGQPADRAKPRRLSKKAFEALRAERQEAAFALLGRAFVQLIREDAAQDKDWTEAALKVAEWLYEHRLSSDEAREFTINTGWVFDCDFAPDPNYRPPYDYPRPELDDDIPF